jgi:hypothetical protein
VRERLGPSGLGGSVEAAWGSRKGSVLPHVATPLADENLPREGQRRGCRPWAFAMELHPRGRDRSPGATLRQGDGFETIVANRSSHDGLFPLEGRAMNEGLKAAIQGWRDRRRRRRIDRLERKNTGRATLRDYKKSTGDEGGAPWGGG